MAYYFLNVADFALISGGSKHIDQLTLDRKLFDKMPQRASVTLHYIVTLKLFREGAYHAMV